LVVVNQDNEKNYLVVYGIHDYEDTLFYTNPLISEATFSVLPNSPFVENENLLYTNEHMITLNELKQITVSVYLMEK
jgi:hypothetical protein